MSFTLIEVDFVRHLSIQHNDFDMFLIHSNALRRRKNYLKVRKNTIFLFTMQRKKILNATKTNYSRRKCFSKCCLCWFFFLHLHFNNILNLSSIFDYVAYTNTVVQQIQWINKKNFCTLWQFRKCPQKHVFYVYVCTLYCVVEQWSNRKKIVFKIVDEGALDASFHLWHLYYVF